MISTFHKILLKWEIKNDIDGAGSKFGGVETCVQVFCGEI
jgi:hypothetical protein